MIGQVLDTYRIEEVLGHGGMGVVYKAIDISLEKVVALKVMNPIMAQDPHFLGRFKAEARALGRLHHPNIVNVFAFRHIGDHLFIVMEFVDGGNLTDFIHDKGSVPWEEALPLMTQALRAIAYAHNENVIHRDLKPRNIMLTPDRVVKVTDFGLAKITAASSESLVATRTGFTGGTLYYMPPEQLEGLLNVDHRGDIYSLGMSFYEMLAGRTPFEKTSSEFKILKAIDASAFPAVNELNQSIPPGLAALVMKSVARNPEDRFQSAEEMLQALQTWDRQPKTNPPLAFSLENDETLLAADLKSLARQASSLRSTTQTTGHSITEQPTVGDGYTSTASDYQSTQDRTPDPDPAPPVRRKWPMYLTAGIGLLLLVITGVIVLTRGDTPAPPPELPPAALTSLSIRTAPGDAAVIINGQTAGTTPVQNWEAEPGEARIRIEKEGYTPLDTALTVQAERDNAFLFILESQTTAGLPELPPDDLPPDSPPDQPEVRQTGSLTVRSEPSGAQVLVDGQAVGVTPYTSRNLIAGRHRLELRLDGYRTVQQQVQVQAGSANTVSQALVRAQGTIRVVVRPYGDIYINGTRKAQETNAAYSETLPTGVYRVQAQHPVLGSWEKRVRVTDGATNEVLFNFRESYRVTVISSPNNAEIILDGQPTGQYTPKELSVPPGQHTLAVRRDGFEMVGRPRQITVEGDLTGGQALSFELRASN